MAQAGMRPIELGEVDKVFLGDVLHATDKTQTSYLVKMYPSYESNQIYLSCRLWFPARMILTKVKSSEVSKRLREAVEDGLRAQKVSARQASLDVVGNDGLIRDIRAGVIPSVDRIEALFDYLGLEAYFGPRREPAQGAPLPLVSNMEPGTEPPSGFSTIPLIADRQGNSTAPVAFSNAWLRRHHLASDFLAAALPERFVLSDPPNPGSLTLIDTRNLPREGTALWCFRDGIKITVAHLTFVDDLAVVHPASHDDDAQVYRGKSAVALGLLGRVVWLGEIIPLKGRVG